MNDEILHLPEVLAADLAGEWLLVAVNPFMNLQVIITGHRLTALVADDLGAGVYLHVRLHRVLPEARVVAHLAGVLLRPTGWIVHGRVQLKTPLVSVTEVANGAGEGFLARVTDDVPLEHGFRGEALVADVAAYLVVVDVVALVLLDVGHAGCFEAAVAALEGAVLVFTLDVVLAAVLGAEELLASATTIGDAVLATARMGGGHVAHAQFRRDEDDIALAALEDALQHARLHAHQEAVDGLDVVVRLVGELAADHHAALAVTSRVFELHGLGCLVGREFLDCGVIDLVELHGLGHFLGR